MHTESDPLAISPMSEADIPEGMLLVAEAGWNQTDADWRFMLANGRGFGLRDAGGRLVASCVLIPYSQRIGWIGMVLVNGAFRRRGYATHLLDNAIDACRAGGLTPMLDATPAGREVYLRLGFRDGESIERWVGTGQGLTAAPGCTIDIDMATRLDAVALGVERRALLDDFARRPGAPLRQAENGVLLGRRGRVATQLGPLVADDEPTALALCADALDSHSGPMLIDVPVQQHALGSLLRSRGFAVERRFTRMALGTVVELGATMRAIAGPELG